MKGDQTRKTKIHRANELSLRINQAVCSTDGINCSDCPVKEKCRRMWDKLQETTETCLTGIPGRYIGPYIKFFDDLQREKWDRYNELVTTKGGNHGSPVR